MDSNLCVICFVNDDRHQVNVGEKGLETLLDTSNYILMRN